MRNGYEKECLFELTSYIFLEGKSYSNLERQNLCLIFIIIITMGSVKDMEFHLQTSNKLEIFPFAFLWKYPFIENVTQQSCHTPLTRIGFD